MPFSKAVYQNPVYPGYFADPFALKTGETYYAYGTGPVGPDGRQFPVLRSSDLIHWEPLGGALEPLTNPPGVNYWAPEVAEKDGRFYLFYSASTSQSDEHHRLRVAIADDPAGPFRDTGRLLIPQLGFTIDASPYHDPKSGNWYLYFATDYETDEPHGTGLSVVQLNDDLLGAVTEPKPVVRASAPWQIYEKNRNYKGRVWPAWNCVEGPSVLYHEGKYYCLYSGGAWYGENYGVGFAVADHPLGPWHDEFAAQGPSVLKGIPGQVVGPGHNSAVLGPDGKTLFMVYHAWDANHTARRMCIDPIRWTDHGPKVEGPSTDTRLLIT
jgi:arabinan endo-1,5-alpha-L-arabinosidase